MAASARADYVAATSSPPCCVLSYASTLGPQTYTLVRREIFPRITMADTFDETAKAAAAAAATTAAAVFDVAAADTGAEETSVKAAAAAAEVTAATAANDAQLADTSALTGSVKTDVSATKKIFRVSDPGFSTSEAESTTNDGAEGEEKTQASEKGVL